MSCMVEGCPNKRKNNFQVSFHRFPRGRLEKEWLKILGIREEDWTWNKNKNVCSKHFKPDDFHIRCGINSLNLNAMPSLFLNNENRSESSFVAPEQPSTSSLLMEDSQVSSSSQTTNDSSLIMSISKKRKPNENTNSSKELEESGKSTSTNSSTKRKRVKLIRSIHNYSTSPTTVKSKSIQVRKRQQRYRKRLFSAHQKINELNREVTTNRSESWISADQTHHKSVFENSAP